MRLLRDVAARDHGSCFCAGINSRRSASQPSLGTGEAPSEISSQIGAMTGSHTLLVKLKSMEAREHLTGTEA
jgi:hypothetical protein